VPWDHLRELATGILEGAPNAILVCDRQGVVHYWNASADRVFGFARLEAVGASLDLIVPQRVRTPYWTGWQRP
jgi:PAS domain S-box-containing protein